MFGSTPAATAAPTALNSTFTFGTSPANTATTTPAAAQPLSFGTGLQNTSTIRPFGSTTAFGTTSAATAPATGTTAFGGTSLFGATQPAAQTTSIFGSTTSTFGATQPTQTTSIFGSTLGATTQTGTTVKFEAVSAQDTMRTKNNTFQTINTKLQCICAMKDYVNKSMEELRMEDYQANRKFGTTTSVFGATSFSSPTPFSPNPSPFGASTTFSTAPAASTTTNIFGGGTTTTASPFGSATATSAAPFSIGTSTAPTTNIFGAPAATTTSPFGVATSTAPATTSIFGAPQPAQTTSIFGSTTTTSPFGAKPATTQPGFGFGTTTTTSTASPFSFGSQPATSTSIFSQPSTVTPFGTTAPTSTTSIFGAPTATTTATNPFGTQPATTSIFGATTSTAAPVFGAATSTPAFTGFGTTAPASTTTSIFGAPAASTATTAPIFGGFGAQTTAPAAAAAPFSFSTTATSAAPTIFGATAPTASTTSSIFNPQPFTGFNLAQTQPAASTATQSFGFPTTTFGSTPATTFGAQTQVQQQTIVQPASVAQQRFLAVSLLDPFASRGKKDFTNIDQIKPPTDLIVVATTSTAPTTTTTTTAGTGLTSAPITLPLQSNSRKASSARPLVDIRFKLKPNTSAPTSVINNNEELKSPNQRPTTPIGQPKSPLTADFSEEEEQVLIGRNKMSKLRLSTEFNDTSFQSESIRSLYPLRRLAELETLANMNNNTHIISTVHTIPSSTSSSSSTTTATIDTASAHISSSTTVNSEQTLHPTNNSRGILPLHHSTPLIVHKQNSPTISHPLTTHVQSVTTPPPRSTTPPPPPISSSNSSQRNRFSSNVDSRAYQLPKLTREDYFMEPSAVELKRLFNDKGQCLVKQFRVGHEKYGSVTFYAEVNVAGLDLDQIIEIDRHELTVYPDDNNKPSVGEELNTPARITLLDVYPTDRTTREEIRDIERIKAMNYADYLREVTKKFDGEFIRYGPEDGSWTFAVKHFTRYGLDGSDDNFVVAKPPAAAAQQKPINPNFLDQTIALNDTYALSSPKTQPMDMEEKENATLSQHHQHISQSNVRFSNQSLIGLRPNIVEQLAQSIFCDEDDDDFGAFEQPNDRMITSTKIITSTNRPAPILPQPIIEDNSAMEQDKTQMIFRAPQKVAREPIHSKLPKNVANIRGRYFRTNFSSQLRFSSIDRKRTKARILENQFRFVFLFSFERKTDSPSNANELFRSKST